MHDILSWYEPQWLKMQSDQNFHLAHFGSKDAKFLHADNEDHTNMLADLSLSWAHMSEGTFSHVTAYMTTKSALLSLSTVSSILY